MSAELVFSAAFDRRPGKWCCAFQHSQEAASIERGGPTIQQDLAHIHTACVCIWAANRVLCAIRVYVKLIVVFVAGCAFAGRLRSRGRG